MAQHLYGRDGIYLHARGCSSLVANINKAVNIIKQKTSGLQDRQANRSVTLHSTQSGSNGYVNYAPERGSSRNGDSRDYQLQNESNAPGRGSRNGYSRDGSGSFRTQTGSYGYGDHAPGHGVTGEMTVRRKQEVTFSEITHRIKAQGMAIHVTVGMARRIIYIHIRIVVIIGNNKNIVSTVFTIITTLVNADDLVRLSRNA
ncbi:hypothetical protein DPMN_190010 [Dreissena polymorpha]|uniref:Uncharacterized protein n=1 Tax=Dreissena polymorpha TaxID=45954 RepID=A0A9D4IBJ9_DREPO|nr:hypothetical protein DPMN_190010 [Dreissena polymorpha]